MREIVWFTCEECNEHEDQVGTLEPHRIRPGFQGGTYNHRNIKMVCSKCHKLFSAAQRIACGQQK